MQSQIQKFFAEKTVFLTGGTGTLGKLVLEKLLRTCWDVDRIWLLLRHKKGVEPMERLTKMFKEPAFGPLKAQKPDFLKKVSIFVGDCELPNLGLTSSNIETLRKDVNVIIHCAATVRLNENLRKATNINTQTVRDLIDIAKEMKQLSSFVHVSTAYSNCVRENIDEIFYEPRYTLQEVEKFAEMFDDSDLSAITPTILGKWPNTYSFTKAVAEDVINKEGKFLPISIIRPSIITASAKEPVPGWVDNYFGGNQIVASSIIGVMKTIHLDPLKTADLIPVDYVSNAILAIAWETGEKWTTDSEPTIYNCVSAHQNPITLGGMADGINKYAPLTRTCESKLFLFYKPIHNKHIFLICELFLHTIPAYVGDFILFCTGKKPKFVDTYKKLSKFFEVSFIFGMRSWNYKDENMQILWSKMNIRDKELFHFDIRNLDWNDYFLTYIRGVRTYLYKEPVDSCDSSFCRR